MSEKAHRVRVVVDPAFGDRLHDFPDREPVWVVNSEANTRVAKRLQMERAGATHLNGVTTFTPSTAGDDRERELLNILDTVDLHHGEFSADPPYSEVEVVGVGITDAIERAFRHLGFTQFQTMSDGFVASRPTAP